METFLKSGKLRHFLTAWHQITNDGIILEVTKNGLKIDFKRYQK